MRVEIEVMAQKFFLDVLVDDFRLVPTPPGSVSPSPLAPEGAVDMGIAAVMPTLQNSFSTMMYTLSSADSSTQSLIGGSSSNSDLDLTLMKVLESATQTPPPSLTTMGVVTEASTANEGPAGSVATQPTETASVSGQSAATGQTVQDQAPQDQTTVTNPPAADSSYQSAPSSVTSTDSSTPAQLDNAAPVFPIGVEPPTQGATDTSAELNLAPAFDPAMSLAFHTNDVSAWDVVNAPDTAIEAPHEIRARKRAGRAIRLQRLICRQSRLPQADGNSCLNGPFVE